MLHVHHVLQENHQNYDKNALIYNNARPFLGNGLPVTHGGEDWIRRRRLMQPAFHRRHVQIVTDATERYLADTTAGLNRIAASGEPLDISLELTRLTMRIICRVLFDVDVAVGSTEIARRFERVSMFAVDFLTRPFPPLFVPTRRNRAFHADMRYINGFVTGIVRERQAGPQRDEDLLGSDFAMAEAVLILATLAQHHRLVLLPDRPVRPGGGITLHPAGGIWAVLEPRSR